MLDIFDTIVAKAAGISKNSPLKGALALRRDILELTENSHEASLRPNQPGGLNHAVRAGLACRIAKLNNESALARHYETMFSVGSQEFANPEVGGGNDARSKAIIRHTDLITLNPKEATADDLSALKDAGLYDADIVRLSQLIAFVSYQVRVVAGLRLMAEVS